MSKKSTVTEPIAEESKPVAETFDPLANYANSLDGVVAAQQASDFQKSAEAAGAGRPVPPTSSDAAKAVYDADVCHWGKVLDFWRANPSVLLEILDALHRAGGSETPGLSQALCQLACDLNSPIRNDVEARVRAQNEMAHANFR